MEMIYGKPSQFSDPYHDWEGYGDTFHAILDKDDQDLTTDDFRIIFAKHLPAADYAEGMYYIDRCIAHITEGRDVHDSRLPEGLLWWIVHFKEQLEADQLFSRLQASFMSAVWQVLDSFELFDLTEQECATLGRCPSYSVSPYNSGTVWDCFDELTIYDEFEEDLDRMVQALIQSDRVEHVRWYVEIAFHTRHWCTTYSVDDYGLDNYVRKEQLFHRLHQFPVLQQKQRVAAEATAREERFKYNRLVML